MLDWLMIGATITLAVWLAALAWIDYWTFRLPDPLTLSLAGIGLGLTFLRTPLSLWEHTLAALAGYVLFAGFGWVYRRARGAVGLGLGDAKLFASAGAWLGIEALPQVLLLAALGSLLHVAVLWLRGSGVDRTTRLPFGPALATAIWIGWMEVVLKGT